MCHNVITTLFHYHLISLLIGIFARNFDSRKNDIIAIHQTQKVKITQICTYDLLALTPRYLTPRGMWCWWYVSNPYKGELIVQVWLMYMYWSLDFDKWDWITNKQKDDLNTVCPKTFQARASTCWWCKVRELLWSPPCSCSRKSAQRWNICIHVISTES